MKRLLFLCSRNRRRSPTAEAIFADYPGIEVDSAGLAKDADTPLSLDQIEWADLIIVMEPIHRKRLNQRFGSALKDKSIVVLGIPDDFDYMDPVLIDRLRSRVSIHLS